ncbi:hypothetical protein RchiOBHm_Chr0c39g0503301 [Rosa chinensis]|uniref:Uncharacterized protein n=1 Tax=Rosa chinensis TaxID=74649 RepID=A0A2P6SQ44_ROSCH|nr:hypothetical protein RchiOBHm_Chr0c39g0503301 [Rosa chinensis]
MRIVLRFGKLKELRFRIASYLTQRRGTIFLGKLEAISLLSVLGYSFSCNTSLFLTFSILVLLRIFEMFNFF